MALKVPPARYAETLGFYRDTLRLPVLEEHSPDMVFQFGQNKLWVDETPGIYQPELWLEIVVADTAAAEQYFAAQGITRSIEMESLPKGFDGFFIRSPSATVHLVCGHDSA